MMLSQFVNKGSDADLVKSMVSSGQIDEELAKSMGAIDKTRDNAAEGDNEEGDETIEKGGDVCPNCGKNPCVCGDDLKKSGDTNEADADMLEKSESGDDDDDEEVDGLGDDEGDEE